MESNKLLKLTDLRKRTGEGLELEDGQIYPWASIGPIEQATISAMQEELRNIVEATDDDGNRKNPTVSEAEHMVTIQRELVAKILPSMPEEILRDEVSDAECGVVIGFFEVWRINASIDTMERQVTPAEKAQALAARARSIGAELSQPSRGSTGANRRPG